MMIRSKHIQLALRKGKYTQITSVSGIAKERHIITDRVREQCG